MDTHSGEVNAKSLCLASEKRSTLKRENLLPQETNSLFSRKSFLEGEAKFYLLEARFWKGGLMCRKAKRSNISYLPCIKWRNIYQLYPFQLISANELSYTKHGKIKVTV